MDEFEGVFTNSAAIWVYLLISSIGLSALAAVAFGVYAKGLRRRRERSGGKSQAAAWRSAT